MSLDAPQPSHELAGPTFFDGWFPEEIEHFERVASRVAYVSGQNLIREGQEGAAFLVIVKGDVDVTLGGETLARLGPGHHVGELALLDGSPTNATVVAVTQVEALVLYERDFHNLLETVPNLGRRLLVNLTGRLRGASQQTGESRRG